MKFRIGRDNNNDWVLNDATVSGIHACIVIEKSHYTIVDLGSTNGTFVNELPVRKKQFSINDEIRLGDLHLKKEELNTRIKEFMLSNKTDFAKEFHALKEVYKKYDRKKNQIQQNEKNKQLILRLIIMLVLLGIAYWIADGKIAYFIIISLVSSVIANLLIKNKPGHDKIEDVYFEFADQIKCPKCKTELINQSWRYWKRQGGCPNKKCDAKWN